jgi:hypothetical protein
MENSNEEIPPVLIKEESDEAAIVMPNMKNMRPSSAVNKRSTAVKPPAIKMRDEVLCENEVEANGQAVALIQMKNKVD